ncbi:hypothetical protein [Streptomyces sennicomposti]|uniref:hypothetical protein n=1 Tax=Streptomyces sennicomposti TaxID=2873384 RepID=UPI0013CDC9F3|nr:hypothetical protein [Streptomyces sennicomposti]MBY8866930.1 hypothetical protein [Streptomyces sennicomposti]NED31910.1 hypothetical protein [Streptomyces sp. SID8499]
MDNTAYTFVVSVNNPLPSPDPPPDHLPSDAEMASTIRLSTARRPEDAPLAHVYAPRTTEPYGRRTPSPAWIQFGPDGGSWCSVRPATPDVYDVHASDGAHLARITRRTGRLLPWPRRVRWSAQLTEPSRTVTGRVGTGYAWFAYAVTAPVWILFALCGMAYSFFDGTADDYTFRRPSRTRWRAPGAGTVLDRRGISKTYRFTPRHLDVRVAYALAVLQTWERER